MNETNAPDPVTATLRRHLAVGWVALLLFLLLGIVLESLHGFKVQWYLATSNESRRMVLRLAHAHGALLALVNIAFACALPHMALTASWRRLASTCLLGATLLLPGGFLVGGLFVHAADPGLGVILVPLGGLLLFVAVGCLARAAIGRA